MFVRVAVVAAVSVVASHAHAQSFEGLGPIPGGPYSVDVGGLSADGSTIVGRGIGYDTVAYSWNDSSVVAMAPPPSFTSFAVEGVSGDGSIVVGRGSYLVDGSPVLRAIRWSGGVGIEMSSSIEVAYAISDDGTVILGAATVDGDLNGIRFETGPTLLPRLTTCPSIPLAISADNNFIAGWALVDIDDDCGGSIAGRWDGAATETYEGFSSSGTRANDVSDDGRTVVGYATHDDAGFITQRPVRWVEGEFLPLGLLPGHTQGEAYAVSADGTTIVGECTHHNPPMQTAFIWTEAAGIRSVADVLTALGADHSGWTLQRAKGISADGTVLAGEGASPARFADVWRAEIGGVAGIVVNDPGDAPDADLDDGRCDSDLSMPEDQCTLRAALEEAEAREGKDTIGFGLEDGDERIVVTSALPTITGELDILAGAVPGDDPRRVFVDGSGLPGDGLVVDGAPVRVEGLAIGGFGGAGVVLGGDGGHVVDGCFIGIDRAGMAAAPNGAGVVVTSPNCVVGTEAGGNLIAGHAVAGTLRAGGSVPDGAFGAGIVVVGGEGTVVDANHIGVGAGGVPLANTLGVALIDAVDAVVGADVGNSISASETPVATALPTGEMSFGSLGGVGIRVSGGSGVRLERNDIGAFAPNGIGMVVHDAVDIDIVDNDIVRAPTPIEGDADSLTTATHGSGVVWSGASSGRVDDNRIGVRRDGSIDRVSVGVLLAPGEGEGFETVERNVIVAGAIGVAVDRPGARVSNVRVGTVTDAPPIDDQTTPIGIVVRATDVVVDDVIVGASDVGVAIDARGVRVTNSLVGLGENDLVLPNTVGIWVAGGVDTDIGGDGEGNVVSGNGIGIAVTNRAGEPLATSDGTSIWGNVIGTTRDGMSAAVVEEPGLVGVYVGSHGFVSGDLEAAGSGGSVDIGIGPDDASGATAVARRNVIAGDVERQVLIEQVGGDPSPVRVRGNYIGLFADGSGGVSRGTVGTAPVVGVHVDRDGRAEIGAADAPNVIGGNALGVWLASEANVVVHNTIGASPSGDLVRPNHWGVLVTASDNRVGVHADESPGPNQISGNAFYGSDTDVWNDGVGVMVCEAGLLERFLDRRNVQLPTRINDDPETVERTIVAHNLVGLTADGESAIAETDDLEGDAGIAVLPGAVDTKVFDNHLGGMSLGITVQAPLQFDGGAWTGTVPLGTRIGGNRIGLPLSAEPGDETYVPIRWWGMVVYGAQNTFIGEGAVDGYGGNVIAGVGAEGSALPPPQRSPGMYLLHPDKAPPGYLTGTNRIVGNWIYGNEGLAITRDLEQLFITPNGPENNDGVSSFNTPRILQASIVGGTLEVIGTVDAAMTVDVFANQECDDSGYGEGQRPLGRFEAVPGTRFVGTVPIPADVSDWRIALTGTNVNGTTSEFSPCQPIVPPGLARTADVDPGMRGKVIDDVGMCLEIPAGPSPARLEAGGGTLFAGRHGFQPDPGAVSGSAIAADGNEIEVNVVVVDRWWSLIADGLDDLTFDICLDVADSENIGDPSRVLVAHRVNRSEPWVPLDTTLHPTEEMVCARVVGQFGQFGVAADSLDGTWTPIDPDVGDPELPPAIPARLLLGPASPNPFHSTATLQLALPEAAAVGVAVFDAAGRRVAEVTRGTYPAGVHVVRVDGADLASGVYFVRAEVGGRELVRRVAVVR